MAASRRLELGTRYNPKSETVQLGIAHEATPPPNQSWFKCVMCCPFEVSAWIYLNIFQATPAAALFYLGIFGTGGGYGVTTFLFSYKIDSIICFANLTKMVGR